MFILKWIYTINLFLCWNGEWTPVFYLGKKIFISGYNLVYLAHLDYTREFLATEIGDR